jgi:hypothetical protein
MAIRNKIADEQTSSLGGWLFADLFLLIMVIGLAGFNRSEKVVTSTTSTTTSTTVVCSSSRFRSTSFRGTDSRNKYTESSALGFLYSDVANWVSEQRFSQPKIAVAILRGGDRQSEGEGQKRAKIFWNSTLNRNEVLGNYISADTAFRPFGTKKYGRGVYEVELFFVETAQDC